MDKKKSFIKAHKPILIETALETLLTSHWLPHFDLPEEICRKIFSEIFSQIQKDLISRGRSDTYYLSQFYLNTFKNKLNLKRNFYAQLAFISIARIVLNHYYINVFTDHSRDFLTVFEKIQKIFDSTLISLGQWWGEIYQEMREKDLQLIGELNLVKNDLQKQLDVIYQILKESPIGVADCDNNLNVLHWNPAAVRLTGYAPTDILKKNIIHIFTNNSKDRLLERLGHNRSKITNLRLYIEPKFGNPFPIFVSVSKIKYFQPSNLHYVFNFLSSGDQYSTEKSKQKLNQLTTITRLTSAIMHDIRNPLNSIGLNAEILEDFISEAGLNNQVKIQELLDKIQKEIHQLSQNLSQYLAYGHLTELHLEPIDLSSKLNTFIGDMRFEAALKKVQIIFKPRIINIWVLGDWVQLNRMFMNIMQNALDVTKENGKVTVKIYLRKNRIIMHFIDDGPGILPAQRKKIYEPFFSTKKTGTGLGLFVVREIILAHKGRISHRPAKNGGTIFTLSLPVLESGEGVNEE